MKTEKDYEELLKLFNRHRVKYCIIGAYAVAFYARPRYTKDMDILVEADVKNGQRIVNALNDFGFKSLGLRKEDFSVENKIIQLGYEPVRIDIITSIPGCEFKEVWRNRKIGKYGRQRVNFIGFNELLKNKRASTRRQDKLDLENLLKSRKSRTK